MSAENMSTEDVVDKYQYQYEQIKSGYIPDVAYSEGGREYGMTYYKILAEKISMALMIIDLLCIIFSLTTISEIRDRASGAYDYEHVAHCFAMLFLGCGIAVFFTAHVFARFRRGSWVFYNFVLAVNAIVMIIVHHTIYRMPKYNYFPYQRILKIITAGSISNMDAEYLFAFIVNYMINLIGIYLLVTIIPNMIYCNNRIFLYHPNKRS